MEALDERAAELIGAAVMAVAYRHLALETPGAERGLLKLADKWSARVGLLAGEIAGEALAASPRGR